MKIAPISFTNYINHTNVITKQYTREIPFDTVSFSSNKPFIQRISELKTNAQDIKTESNEILDKAKELAKIARKHLKEAKAQYLYAHQYIDIAKRCILSGGCELDNGHTITSILSFEDEVASLRITEFDIDEMPIKEIIVQDSKPVSVAIYGDEETNIYDFINRTVEIHHDVQPDSNDDMIAKYSFTFDGGNLLSIKTNSQIEKEPSTCDKFYYFLDDSLNSCLINCKLSFTNAQEAREKFNFSNNKLTSYFKNFAGFAGEETSWDEGYYFKNGKLIGYSENNNQDSWDSEVMSDEVIFSNNQGEFIHQDNITFKLDDFGNANFY